jgi:hypothetical protein
MERVRYVGWATRSRVTVKVRLFVFKKKKKNGSSQLMVSKQFKCNKRAIENLKSFNKDRKLKCNTPYALHEFCDVYLLIYV